MSFAIHSEGNSRFLNNLDQFNFISNYADMLNALLISKESGNVIAFNVPEYKSIFISAVEDLVEEADPIVVLKNTDVTGAFLDRNKIRLSEIESLCPLMSKWKNPYLKELYKDKTPMLDTRISDSL